MSMSMSKVKISPAPDNTDEVLVMLPGGEQIAIVLCDALITAKSVRIWVCQLFGKVPVFFDQETPTWAEDAPIYVPEPQDISDDALKTIRALKDRTDKELCASATHALAGEKCPSLDMIKYVGLVKLRNLAPRLDEGSPDHIARCYLKWIVTHNSEPYGAIPPHQSATYLFTDELCMAVTCESLCELRQWLCDLMRARDGNYRNVGHIERITKLLLNRLRS